MSIEKTSDNITPSPAAPREVEFYEPGFDASYLRPRYWATWLLLALLRSCVPLPLCASRAVGALLGWSFFLVNSKRRRIARVNLRLCFPELAAGQRRSLLRRHFVTTGRSYADLGFLAWAPPARIERKVRVLGLEHLRTVQQRGERVILLVPHCLGVNFGSIVAKHYPVFSMFKPPRDALLNWFLNKGRMRFGARLLTRKQGLRPVLRALRQEMAFYYIPDEDFGPKRSVFAPFFGIPTATLPTLGRLAASADAVVIPLFVRMLPRGEGYEMLLSAPLQDFPSDDPVLDATRMNRVLEASIREVPEQYMWTLKLFKTRPGNVPSPYR